MTLLSVRSATGSQAKVRKARAPKSAISGAALKRTSATHFFRFSAVGAVGIGVQLTALALLHRIPGFHYLIAVGLSVELAILHNFFWHIHWTWRDRGTVRFRTGFDALWMLLRFNYTTGAVSLCGNLVFMRFIVGQVHVGLLRANILSIVLCWLLNFLLSDRVVFV